jgi:hypothetical protein
MQRELNVELAEHLGSESREMVVGQARVRDWLAAALGPASMGAILAWRDGWSAALTRAALVPLILVGVLVAMAPALYVGRALSQRALAGDEAASAAVNALTEMGKTALGFAPLAVLLGIDSPWSQPTRPAVLAVLVLSMAFGYLSLYRALFAHSTVASRLLFVAWALIGSGIAVRLIDVL